MFDALMSPWAFAGALVGLGLAAILYWIAPAGVDVVQAAAWFVVIGAAAGLGWDLLTQKKC